MGKNTQGYELRRESMRAIAVKHKLSHCDNATIAKALAAEGFTNQRGEPYSEGYVAGLVRDALREIATERSDNGKLLQISIQHDLEELLNTWRPLALGEIKDDNGDPIQPSAKAAEIVRKTLADLATLTGAQEAAKMQLEVKMNSELDQFVTVMKHYLPEEIFDQVLKAIDTANQDALEYWREKRSLRSADPDQGDTIDINVEQST